MTEYKDIKVYFDVCGLRTQNKIILKYRTSVASNRFKELTKSKISLSTYLPNRYLLCFLQVVFSRIFVPTLPTHFCCLPKKRSNQTKADLQDVKRLLQKSLGG